MLEAPPNRKLRDNEITEDDVPPPLHQRLNTIPAIPVTLTVISGPGSVTTLPPQISNDMNAAASGVKPNKIIIPAEPKKAVALNPQLMNVTPFKQPRDEFFYAAKAHLTKKASGGLTEYMISGTAVAKWSELLKKPSYYIHNEDIELILEHGLFYSDIARDFGQYDGPLTLFELGSGPASMKTRYMVNAIDPDNYVVAEKSMEAIAATMTMIGDSYSHVKGHAAFTDFNRDDMEKSLIMIPSKVLRPVSANMGLHAHDIGNRILPQEGRRVFIQFGATLGNMEGFYNSEMPAQRVIGALRNYRRHANVGDIMILSIDQNQDEKSIMACYGDEIHAELAEETIQHMKDSLPAPDFSPEDFSFTHFWNKTNHLHALGWRAKRDVEFTVDGEKTSWKKDEFLAYANQWHYRQKFINKAYAASDWDLVAVKTHSGFHMTHQVLRAVPGRNHLDPTI